MDRNILFLIGFNVSLSYKFGKLRKQHTSGKKKINNVDMASSNAEKKNSQNHMEDRDAKTERITKLQPVEPRNLVGSILVFQDLRSGVSCRMAFN